MAWLRNWQGFRWPRGALGAQALPASRARLACGWDAVPECSRAVTIEESRAGGPSCSCAGGMESPDCPLHPSADSGLQSGPPGAAQTGRSGHPQTAWGLSSPPGQLSHPAASSSPPTRDPRACLLTLEPSPRPQVLLMGWSLPEHLRVDLAGPVTRGAWSRADGVRAAVGKRFVSQPVYLPNITGTKSCQHYCSTLGFSATSPPGPSHSSPVPRGASLLPGLFPSLPVRHHSPQGHGREL